MIRELTRRLDQAGRWTVMLTGTRALVVGVCSVFATGSAFAYYSSNIVMQAEFEPVQTAVKNMEGVPKKLDSIEKWLFSQATCQIHRGTYIRDLADYSAKVRLTLPTMSAAYRDCLTITPLLDN